MPVDKIKPIHVSGFRGQILLGIFLFSYILFVIAGTVYAENESQFKYDAAGKRNPFIPLITPDGRLLNLDTVVTETGLVLEGVIFDQQGESFALINGKVFKVGDSVDDYTVLDIDKGRVNLLKAGQLYVLETKKGE